MIDALIAGKLYSSPKAMMSKVRKPFATAKLLVATADGHSVFVNVIAFDPQAVSGLLALKSGDAVAVCGTAKPTVYADKQGQHRPAVDMVARQVLAAFQVNGKHIVTCNLVGEVTHDD